MLCLINFLAIGHGALLLSHLLLSHHSSSAYSQLFKLEMSWEERLRSCGRIAQLRICVTPGRNWRTKWIVAGEPNCAGYAVGCLSFSSSEGADWSSCCLFARQRVVHCFKSWWRGIAKVSCFDWMNWIYYFLLVLMFAKLTVHLQITNTKHL